MSKNWSDFWRQKNEFDNSMGVNYNHFLERVKKYVVPHKESVVLDIGSGPGNLEDAWHDKVKEIHGVDISERYNAIGREKHKDHPNVFFHDLPANDYLNFSMLREKKFDLIIVMSVLQYYRNKEEVVRLLENIRLLTKPKAQILLCDLIVQHSMLKEVFQVFWEYFRAGKFFSALSLFFRLRFSTYYDYKKDNGFLMLSQEEWKKLLAQLHLKATFLDQPLTLQKSRKNILISMD
ncbi:MAG: methyltransferase type 12 [Segetibacter sp.]|nr:methyltransferase type 12 [Segetibacter sp.]